MNGLRQAEQVPRIEEMPELAMQFGMPDFDIDAAFQSAMAGVVTDKELALDEKVRRMENIISEGTSPVYQGFVDFRAMAAQMEMMCNHDHGLRQFMQGSETLSGFMDSHRADDGHGHAGEPAGKHGHESDDDKIDPKTGKKTKKKRSYSWLSLLLR